MIEKGIEIKDYSKLKNCLSCGKKTDDLYCGLCKDCRVEDCV